MAVMIRALRRGEGERPAAGQAGLEVLVLTSARVHRNYSSVQTHWPQSKRSSCQAVAARHVAGLPSEICTISSLCTTHTNIECRPGQSCWGVERRSICKKKKETLGRWIFYCSSIICRDVNLSVFSDLNSIFFSSGSQFDSERILNPENNFSVRPRDSV